MKPFLTLKQQQICLFIYEENNNWLCFEEQSIYKDRHHFHKEMQKLVFFEKVLSIERFSNQKLYKLSIAGKLFVEMFILKYQERIK